MPFVRLKKYRFEIAGQPLDRRVFRHWVGSDGRVAHVRHWRTQRARWFFGRQRARSRVWREACQALQPGAAFARTLERHLDQLPILVRRLALATFERGHKDLFSVDDRLGLVVVPRGMLAVAFRDYLLQVLGETPLLGALPGLARRIIEPAARQAEMLFFSSMCKRRGLLPDASGKGGVLGADPAFAWRIHGTDGHYYYAFSRLDEMGEEELSLSDLETDMREFRHAQSVHLTRMSGFDRNAVRDRYDVGDVVSVFVAGGREPATGLQPWMGSTAKVELIKTLA